MKRRALNLAGLAALTLPLLAEDKTEPFPSLPPEPRQVQFEPTYSTATSGGANKTDSGDPKASELGKDLEALRVAVDRVNRTIASTGDHSAEHAAPEARNASEGSVPESADPGKAVASEHLNLKALRYRDGSADITADIKSERLEVVYKELASLIGHTLDDSQVISTEHPVTLHLNNVPWQEALDRLLGQVGCAWAEQGRGPTSKIVVFDVSKGDLGDEQRARMVREALMHASNDRTSSTSAEALYLLAVEDKKALRSLDAIRGFTHVVEDFASRGDQMSQVWVLRSIYGIGETMMDVQQYQDARSVYLNYIAKAPATDPDLPKVYLAAAQASRLADKEQEDPDDAINLLHTMLSRFESSPSAIQHVAKARLTLGELLIRAERFEEAEAQLKLFARAAGKIDEQVQFWMAECAFAQGRYEEARPTFDSLAKAYRAHTTDGTMPEDNYAKAAYRIGQCHLKQKDAKPVNALFAFLRAHQMFPKSELEGEIMVSIALCYAELEREDQSIESLWDLLKSDALDDNRAGKRELEDLFDEVENKLSSYKAPIRARVLFYIAEANYRQAKRSTAERAKLAGEAIYRYERVINKEQPTPELRQAATFGLARATLLSGKKDQAEAMLCDFLRDETISDRDRELAGQLLGSYYRDEHRYRDAITAFQGKAPEKVVEGKP